MTRVWSAVTKTMVVRCDHDVAPWHYEGEDFARLCSVVARTQQTGADVVAAYLESIGWACRAARTSQGVALVKDLCPAHAMSPIVTIAERSARATGADLDPRDPTGRVLVPRSALSWKDPDYSDDDREIRFVTEPRGTALEDLDSLRALETDPDHPPRKQLAIHGFEAKTTTGSI